MTCALCGLTGTTPLIEEERYFCCRGCRAVWHLLSARGGLDAYRDHPVFKQAVASGVISNPELKGVAADAEEMKRLAFEIREMWCPSCAEVIEILLLQEKGVLSCKVDYATDMALVEYDPKKIASDGVFSFIRGLGYDPLFLEEAIVQGEQKGLTFRLFIASFSALNVMMFSYPIYASYFDYEPEGLSFILGWMSFLFTLPVITYCLWPITRRFFCSLKTALYGMESLVMVGVTAAFVLSTMNLLQGSQEVYFDTLTAIVAFVLWGKRIEGRAKLTSKEAFYALARSLPQRARKKGVFVSLKEIEPGDLIECVAGERIPLDGVVVEGEAWVNESALTGESLPSFKSAEAILEAGGIVETGRLVIKVAGRESILNRMVDACKINLEQKSQYIRTLDPWVRGFVPAVLLLAGGVYGFTGSFSRALALLVISCPCAIGIAAPLVEYKMLQAMTQAGALIRNRAALFKLPFVTLWAFDKTGTLTEGSLQVEGVNELSEDEKRGLKGLCRLSRHPVSRAIFEALPAPEVAVERVFEVEGEGISATCCGKSLYLGSAFFLKKQGIEVPLNPQENSEAWFYTGSREVRLTLKDKIKPEAKNVISQFNSTLLLSGDSSFQPRIVGQSLGVTEVLFPLKPLEKKKILAERKAQGEVVVFVGDGLNDAPALAEADIGIAASGSLGLAQAASDILLTQPSLEVLLTLRAIALKGRRRIRENLFWAFFYNGIGMFLAVFGLLTPLFSAFSMTISSLIVIFNSRRE